MKNINLISESELFQDKLFYIADYYGDKTVVLRITENEFVHRSLFLCAYGMDLKPLPYKRAKIDGLEHKNIKDYYCGRDFFIIADKGTVGFDGMVYISKCHVEETDTEFIVKVALETDETIKDKLLEAYRKNEAGISFFFHDNFFSRINDCPAPVTELAKKAEETPFLDVSEDNEYVVRLKVDLAGAYQLDIDNKGYSLIDEKEPVDVGSFLYARQMENSVEIAEIRQIAHSVYGQFYAVLEPVYVYPRDSEVIKQKFPQFFKAHCMTRAERDIKEFIGNPENLPFIAKVNGIGEAVIYQPLNTTCGYPGISSDIFQFMIGGKKGFGDYDLSGGAFIRVAQEAMTGTLIQVDGRFKILLYKCEGVIKHKSKHYVKFKYEDESEFFNDFSHASKSAFKKWHHRDICRNVEYLLCRDKITPIVISKEKYDAFSQNR